VLVPTVCRVATRKGLSCREPRGRRVAGHGRERQDRLPPARRTPGMIFRASGQIRLS